MPYFLVIIVAAIPFIKWVFALTHPEMLKRVEGMRAQKMIEAQNGPGEKDQQIMAVAGHLLTANNLKAIIRVFDGPVENAIALPNNRIYLWRGILDLVGEDKDMLAGVIAHELGHLKHDHYLQRLRRMTAAEFALGIFGGGWFRQMIKKAVWHVVSNGYSQVQENEADAAAIQFMIKAGYDPEGLARLFEALAKRPESQSPGLMGTHPKPLERADRVRRLNTGLQKHLSEKSA